MTTGRNGVRTITHFDHERPPGRASPARCRSSTRPTCLDPKEIRRTDRFTQFAIASAKLAWAGRGRARRSRPSAGGAVYATGIGGIQTLLQRLRRAAREGTPARVALHGPHAHGERRRRAHRHDLRAHRAQPRHDLGVRVVEPRDRRGHAHDPRRLRRPLRRRRLRGRHHPAHRRRVRADDRADEEPRPGDRLAALRRRPQRLRALRRSAAP